jgi:streptogramin lyase
MTDGETTLYHSRYGQGVIVAIDTETVMPIAEYAIPAYVHGISVDFNGYVWGVTFSSNSAYRLDVETQEVETYDGLNYAYTYSDMTGFGLSSVVTPNG